ncbi:uncharacterized protein CMU_020030 [Cryptosporidium muris RN66]|uniref:EF-hand domain-containing protein n=1 Tax=Cryptosporidium muris (strain RN66) TaxID=441375 RepID=B6AJC2_CRYMR|nr:uncharacterized protein CMU_020030 [Cryptosporidium muris RN66]EEA08260.1 hypothetical protein, conserved [Cryptosporidium muris RN66]|eukprot:XP_002142609.1 hypothetical protein [Cryptosporidium muris RN66]
MEIINQAIKNLRIRYDNLHVEDWNYGELVVLIDIEEDNKECSDIEVEIELDSNSNKSTDNVLEMIKEPVAKREPTIYEIEFEKVADSDNKCNINQLKKYLHTLGLAPTESQMLKIVDKYGDSKISLENALMAYKEISNEKYTNEDLSKGIESDSTMISRKRLHLLLEQFGDHMTAEEIDTALDKLGFQGLDSFPKKEFLEALSKDAKQVQVSENEMNESTDKTDTQVSNLVAENPVDKNPIDEVVLN